MALVNVGIKARSFRRNKPGDPPISVTYDGPGGDSARGMLITATPTASTKALRQGALSINLNRAAAQADTTWDGNPDTALNISATTNATGNTAGEGAIRGLQVAARNKGTNLNWVLGANISGRNDNGKQCTQIHAMDLRVENYGNVATEIVGIDVNLSDENSNVDPHLKYGIRVRNTDASGMGAVDAALHVSHSSTNGFDHFAHFATATGDGVVASVATPAGNTTEALIVKIAGNTRYIPVYAAVGFGG